MQFMDILMEASKGNTTNLKTCKMTRTDYTGVKGELAVAKVNILMSTKQSIPVFFNMMYDNMLPLEPKTERHHKDT